MRTIIFCSKCHFIGSIEKGDAIPQCPKCGTDNLCDTDFDREMWTTLSDDKKLKLVEIWSGSGKTEAVRNDEPEERYEAPAAQAVRNYSDEAEPSYSAPVYNANTEYYLSKIESHMKNIKFWVNFWSIIALIAIIGAAVFFLFLQRLIGQVF